VSSQLTPERWRRVKDVLGDALEMPADRRAAFLQSACSGDEDLRRRVEDLIAAESQSWTLADHADTPPPPAPEAGSPAREASGRRIGHYEIVREIGRGGMGAVYLARRHDDFEKRVAIKLVRSGLGDFEAQRRFLAERQIAARLEHPNIARLLDGGATPEGEPYFVMEYVEGEPLLDWCDAHLSSIQERLDLFQRICAAVAFAHRNLVVHRDIKPANVLVTADGTPKLLDFGIARLLDEEGRPAGATDTLFRVMTPDYASPEQIRGAPITTATDVYSLGVVLYELLTGRRPYRLATGRTDELIRVVCDTEPERPSTAASRGRPEEAREQAGSPPSGETATSLARRLRGDLDAIVAKAMRKEPERRYGAVEQLADDLRRHREGLPVLARRGTLAYRAGKFVRRHRAVLAAAALVFVALAGGVVATVREARRARAAEQRAQRRFDDVRKLANSLLFEFDDAIRELPGSTRARQMLVQRALQYLDVLSRESAGDRRLRRELADAYQKVGDVQGNPFHANLGDMTGALDSYGKAIALLEPIVSSEGTTAEERSSLATAYLGRGGIEVSAGRSASAVADSRKAVALREGLAREAPSDGARQMALAQSLQFLAFHLQAMGDLDPAEAALRRQSEILRERERAEPGSRAVRRAIEQNLYVLASTLESRERSDEALSNYREAVSIIETLRNEDPASQIYARDLGYALTQVGNIEISSDPTAALDSYRGAIAAFGQLAAADPKSVDGALGVAMSRHNAGEALTRLRRDSEALAEYRLSRPTYEAILAASPENIWVTRMLADLYVELARFEPQGSGGACSLLRRATTLFERVEASGSLSKPSRERLELVRRREAGCAAEVR
jgi:serine/threonine protein kinase